MEAGATAEANPFEKVPTPARTPGRRWGVSTDEVQRSCPGFGTPGVLGAELTLLRALRGGSDERNRAGRNPPSTEAHCKLRRLKSDPFHRLAHPCAGARAQRPRGRPRNSRRRSVCIMAAHLAQRAGRLAAAGARGRAGGRGAWRHFRTPQCVQHQRRAAGLVGRSSSGPARALDSDASASSASIISAAAARAPDQRPGEVFPSVGTYDQAEVLLRLLDHLGIPALHAIVGASYGGMVALAFARAISGTGRAPARDQRSGPCASDGDRLALRAAAHRALRPRSRRRCREGWSSRARWRWRPIAAPKNSLRASAHRRSQTPTAVSSFQSRTTCSRAAPTTPRNIGRSRSSACPSRSTCMRSMPARIARPSR